MEVGLPSADSVFTRAILTGTRLLKLLIETSLFVRSFRLSNHLPDRVGFAYFIKTDQTVLNGKDLMNCRVREHVALQIFDDLTDGDNVPVVLVRLGF